LKSNKRLWTYKRTHVRMYARTYVRTYIRTDRQMNISDRLY